jgi:hypothetical protein
MLIQPDANTLHPDRAFVPRELGLLLERARLAKIVDAQAEPANLDYSPWVLPAWPTRH